MSAYGHFIYQLKLSVFFYYAHEFAKSQKNRRTVKLILTKGFSIFSGLLSVSPGILNDKFHRLEKTIWLAIAGFGNIY